MNKIVLPYGDLAARKMQTSYKGEVFTSNKTINENGTPVEYKDFLWSNGDANGTPQFIKLGTENVLGWRGERSTLPGYGVAEKNCVYKINTKIEANTGYNPKILANDLVMCIDEGTTTTSPKFIKISGSSSDAIDSDFIKDGTRLAGCANVNEALAYLSGCPFEIVEVGTPIYVDTLKPGTIVKFTNEDWEQNLILKRGKTKEDDTQFFSGVKNSLVYITYNFLGGKKGFTINEEKQTITVELLGKVLYTPQLANDVKLSSFYTLTRGSSTANDTTNNTYKNCSDVESALVWLGENKADLDSNGKIFIDQLPDTVLGGLNYCGVLNVDVSNIENLSLQTLMTNAKTPKTLLEGDYWLINFTNNTPNTDGTPKIVTFTDGYKVANGDMVIYQTSEQEIEGVLTTVNNIGVISNSDTSLYLTTDSIEYITGNVTLNGEEGRIGVTISDNTVSFTLNDEFLPVDLNTVCRSIPENEMHVAYATNGTINQLSTENLIFAKANKNILFKVDGGWVQFDELAESFTKTNPEKIAYQSWVLENTFSQDDLAHNIIPIWDNNSKTFVDSPISIDNTSINVSNLTTLSISSSTFQVSVGGKNFHFDNSELTTNKSNTHIIHDDSIIDCGEWKLVEGDCVVNYNAKDYLNSRT